MRIAGAILLSAICFFAGVQCHAQDPCSARFRPKPGEKPVTTVELVDRVLRETSPEQWRRFHPNDVQAILRCGSPQDADEFFAAIHNASAQIGGVTVLEADQNSIRVVWDDGFDPHLAAFWFTFDRPLTVIPHPGEKVVIGGTYSSYSRDPLRIKLTSSSFSLMP